MKPLPVLLGVSLAANLALVALALRPGAPAPAPAPSRLAPSARASAAGAPSALPGPLAAALASGDAAALAAAGVPPETIKALLIGRAFDVFQARTRASRMAEDDARYWRKEIPDYLRSREQRLESIRALREFSEALQQAYGQDLGTFFGGRERAWSLLAPEKRDKLRQIERDYADMEQQIYADQTAGIELPSDREKLKLLRAEKERDIAALLTASEREQVALRDSSAASVVRRRFGDVLETEEDYKRVYALQKAFDDRYNSPEARSSSPGPEQVKARREAEQKLLDDIREAIGPEQWAAAQRANDQDSPLLSGLTRRLNLPASAAADVMAVRENYAAQSMRINADAALAAADRKSQLQALQAKAQAELTARLGPEVGPAFAEQAAWMNMMKSGQAFSLNAADAPNATRQVGTVAYPVPPPAKEPAPPRN